MKKRFAAAFYIILGLGMMQGCASNMQPSQRFELEPKLEIQINDTIAKRKNLLQGNTQYFNFVDQLNLGRKQLLNKESKAAFATFDAIMANDKYEKYPEFQFAKYYLAVSMYDMGVRYGSLMYFVDILEKDPLLPHTHECLRRAVEIAQELKDDELILYIASKITTDKVPLSLREEFRYYIGKSLYTLGKYDQAINLLNGISYKNRLYLGAQYLEGAIRIQQNNLDESVENFRKVSTSKGPIAYYDEARIKQISNLALGRVFYEKRNYPLSILYYKKVKRDSEFFPTALYEASWGLFKMNKYNETLSVLHSLHSPFIEQVFYTKSYLLKAAVFIDMCDYGGAVKALGSVEKNFISIAKQIDLLARSAHSPQEYYRVLRSQTTNAQTGESMYVYRELFNLSAADKNFLNTHKFITHLEGEQNILNSLNNKRATVIARLLSLRIQSLSEKASFVAGQQLLKSRQLIEQYLAIKDVLKYEITSAERKILGKRSLKMAPTVLTDADLIKPEFTDSLKETMIWWELRGDEYWEDEVGYYLYDLPTRCKETKDE
jgi:tetratricopeptide (TPR) repeat protein